MNSTLDLQAIDRASKAASRGGLLALAVIFTGIVVSSLQLAQMRPQVAATAQELTELRNQAQEQKKQLSQQAAIIESQKSEALVQQKKIQALKTEMVSLEKKKQAYQQLFNNFKAPKAQMERAINATLQENPKVAEIIPRIYIQIGSESQRAPARALASKLEDAGYIMPGIELVSGFKGQKSDVRHYSDDQNTKKELQRLIELLNGQGVRPISKYLPQFRNLAQSRPLQFELWLGQDFPGAPS